MSKTRIERSGPIAHLILDDADEKLNTLGKAMIAEIGEQVTALGKDVSVQAIVIRSGKPSGFLAGANLVELQALARSKQPKEDGYAAARAGQELMNIIEDCPKPVVAAIHGPALGGGCELALASHARVAALDSAKIGLPELQLGILPGFGGSWRMPRLLTFAGAVPLILASTQLDAKRALKAGLVDDACALELLPQVAEDWARKLIKEGEVAVAAKRRAKLPWMNKLLDMPGLVNIVLSKAHKEVMAKTKGQYPAPLKALALLATHSDDRAAFLEREARALGELMATDVCRSLVGLFFLGQDAKKQVGDAKGAKVHSVGIVGAGFMGSGIAIPLVSRAKLPVALKDASPEVLGRALKKIWDSINKRLKKRQLTQTEANNQFYLASASTQMADYTRTELVIEAVPEILDLKHKVFAELEAVLPPTAIIASNTSTLPIADLAAKALRPERFIGMHFFSPAELMPLVEVIPGPKTSPQTIATVVDLALKMGKTPVVVRDSPGFVVNRILMPYILEAVQMVEEGVPVAKVDAAAVAFGMPVGPIKLIGEVGVEVITKVFGILNDHYKDHLPQPKWITREDLKLAFPKGADGKLQLQAAMIEGWVGKPDPNYPELDIQDRLFHALLNEGSRCLGEGLVPEAGYLDLAMIYGTGFPPFRGGLLKEADHRGVPICLKRGEELAAKYGKHLSPPSALLNVGSFYP
jgi:3-hydroxyacyl-CoA dehydrogenase/enoyl-CoA hydratase/3-hydroxybutyryl-CoA epimerase